MQILKIISFIAVVGFLGLQFFRSEKNDAPPDANDLFALYPASPEVKRLVEASCYDCHSNRTRYPWYAEVQPVGWWLAQHVREGKQQLNFSGFGAYSEHRRAQKMLAVADEIHGKTMPLKSYTRGHPEARLSETQIRLLIDWAEELADKIDSGG